MPLEIPLLKSETHYVMHCPIGDETILFDVRWNSREAAWYVDIYESDDTVIALNVKIVLGVQLARRSQHEFFHNNRLVAIDTTDTGTDATFDDLGSRVVLVLSNNLDLL